MKKTWIAVLLSFLLPGLGHIYVKKPAIGIALIILSISVSVMANQYNKTLGLIYFVLWIFAMIHSAKIAKEYNRHL